jgi:cell division protein FtsL
MPPTTARRGHVRTRTAPARPRRVSGPIARPRPVPSVALPAPRRGTTGVFERLKALPESRFVDRVLRGRVWIWMIGILLGGIVAMQVSLLKMNAGISHSVEQAGTLERVNADLETEVARLSSGERIQQVATKEGMVTPPAGDVAYLRARPQTDPGLAGERMVAPSDEAEQLMANGGRAPAALTLAPAPVATVVPETAATPAPVPAATPSPVATAIPAPVVTPVPTAAPTGATTAPTG